MARAPSLCRAASTAASGSANTDRRMAQNQAMSRADGDAGFQTTGAGGLVAMSWVIGGQAREAISRGS